jgi:hypothetical protein
MLSGLASSTRAISVSFDKQATTTDKVQAGISGIISLTNMVISAANQRNAKEKEYQQNAIAFEHEYKVLLNERLEHRHSSTKMSLLRLSRQINR